MQLHLNDICFNKMEKDIYEYIDESPLWNQKWSEEVEMCLAIYLNEIVSKKIEHLNEVREREFESNPIIGITHNNPSFVVAPVREGRISRFEFSVTNGGVSHWAEDHMNSNMEHFVQDEVEQYDILNIILQSVLTQLSLKKYSIETGVAVKHFIDYMLRELKDQRRSWSKTNV